MPLPVFVSETLHHEAIGWATRVSSNGGVVSSNVIRAVSQFCADIDRNNLRDRFLRLNLFSGGNLSGALVPLYRSTAFGGTLIGNATDTNVNFVSGDFAETGSTGGLKGNGTNKYLNTGLVPSTSLTLGNTHLSAFIATAPTSGTFPAMLSAQSASALFQIVSYQSSAASEAYFVENLAAGGILSAANNPTGLFLGSAVSTSDRRCYLNGSQSGTTATTSPASQLPTASMFVFANNNSGSPSVWSSARISTYSIGLGMTGAQVAAYNTALAAFRSALGRA